MCGVGLGMCEIDTIIMTQVEVWFEMHHRENMYLFHRLSAASGAGGGNK